jgi:hypothetical protein
MFLPGNRRNYAMMLGNIFGEIKDVLAQRRGNTTIA